MIGLVVLVVAASALLSISQLRPLFDSSVQPGGLLGTIVAEGLASGLNTNWRDRSLDCDCCNRVVAGYQFLVRSTIRNHRR